MTAEVRAFPGVSDASLALDEQPDASVIAFCEDILERARSGSIQAIAVAMVQPGRVTADAWRRAVNGSDCAHELMAAITYLQVRYAAGANDRSESEGSI